MFINNLPQNNAAQNFGFTVKVKERSKLVDMKDSYLFRTLPNVLIDEFEKKAEKILPDNNLRLEYSIWKKEPREYFSVDIYSGDKLLNNTIGHDARGLLNYLKKATNPYVTLHSQLFYGGQKSPEMLAKIERFKETVYAPLNKYK